VHLQIRESVDDVDTRLLQLARPLDVAPLVESGLELDDADRLLPLLGSGDQRGHERAVAARAVDGGLDRDDARVLGGGADERLEARRERLVRLMDEHVRATDDVEQVARVRRAGERGRCDPGHRPMLELRPVELRDLIELGEVEEPAHLVDLLRRDIEAMLEPTEHVVRHRARDLQAHDVAEPPALQLELDRLEQVVGLVRHLEVGVSRHPEHGALGDLHPGEQLRQEVRDDVLERDESAAAGERHEAGQRLGHLDAREALLAGLRVPREHAEREREARDVREGLPGTDAERGEDGEDLAREEAFQLGAVLLRQVVDRGDRDADGVERGAQALPPDARLRVDELRDALADGGQGLPRRQPVDRPDGEPGRGLSDEAGDAHHEELVEVRREEPAHADPLE
jgi:hypothetical protein